MATAEATRPELTDDQLVELMDLIKDADSVELKLTVRSREQRSALMSLGMDPLDAQVRVVYFFDTPDLTLFDKGVIVRARRVQGKGDDSVVKLRPVVPDKLPRRLRRLPEFGVEVDALPGGYVCSASMKGVPKVDVRETVTATPPALRKMFSKEQRAFYAEHAPADVALDDLTVLGPIFVLKLKFTPKGYDRKLVAELWLYPDGTRILELSTKCGTAEAFQVAAETRAFLVRKKIDPTGEQEPKTRKALEFFGKAAR